MVEFRKEIKSESGVGKVPKLQHILTTKKEDNKLLTLRHVALEEFLDSLLQLPKICRFACVREFLNLPDPKNIVE